MATSSFENLSDVATSTNEFSSDLYKILLSTTKGQNIFFSPISITTALSMTYIGARGETAKQMKNVLRYENIQGAKLHQSFKQLNALLYGRQNPYILKSANRLFGQHGFSILDEFQQQTKTHYLSELVTHDFVGNGKGAAAAINAWVEGQTNGKIKNLIQEIDPLTRLILVNAIYFKGNWLNQFSEHQTRRDMFHVSSNEKVECELMYQKERYNLTYDSINKCLVLELPYKGNDLSMLIALPDEVDGLAMLEHKLSAPLLKTWTEGFRKEEVEVYLPKYNLTQKFRLSDALIAMGMGDIFDMNKADLSGVSVADNLYVSEILHKAFIEVNEQGSEAAAVTYLEMIPMSCAFPPSPRIIFRADHPFIFFIRDQRTGVVLFMGRMLKPRNYTWV